MDRSRPRIALVTGGASGIGLATARRLCKRGVQVAIGDVDFESGKIAADAINGEGGTAVFVALNVAESADWERAASETTRLLGPIDILVNNAAILRDRSLSKMAESEWDAVLDVNLRGVWLGCRTVFQGMRERKWGRILNLSSTAYRGSFGQANYAAAKAGVIGLSRTVALEGLKHGVLVNVVAPHNVDTPMLAGVPDAIRSEWLLKSKVGRYARPDEIAAVIDFFVSEDNSFVSGQVIEVDGGETIGT